jgi:hypothetical protein
LNPFIDADPGKASFGQPGPDRYMGYLEFWEQNMSDIVTVLEKIATPGTVIPKPEAKADFKVKGWGSRRGEHALIYTIPNHKNPSKPYEKGITNSEWRKAYQHLTSAGSFGRTWFNQALPACAKEGGCNFTTIGGMFELLGYAAYNRGEYRAVDK